MKEKFKEYADRQVLVNDLAERIGRLLKQGVKENGRASLAVSGGSTPVDLFERLSILDIPWLNVVVTLVDERWVEPTASDSNENLVRTHLLKNRAVAEFSILSGRRKKWSFRLLRLMACPKRCPSVLSCVNRKALWLFTGHHDHWRP